jgi:very-short-patch-repair endonuclease
MAIPPQLLKNARELRNRLTDAETLLWQLLRDRRFCGYKFRRQHPIGGFILDFYCHEEKLAIELDGGGHSVPEQSEYDKERTNMLEGAGIRVLRFWNHEVLADLESVTEAIYTALSPPPGASRHPLPKGEGKG